MRGAIDELLHRHRVVAEPIQHATGFALDRRVNEFQGRLRSANAVRSALSRSSNPCSAPVGFAARSSTLTNQTTDRVRAR